MKTIALFALLLSAGGKEAFAAATGGAESFNFLLLDGGGRPAALGGAYAASSNDANALQYNPAGLGRVARHEATFMHEQRYDGVTHDYAGIALSQGFGLSASYLDFGDAPRTTISNPNGTALGKAEVNSLAVALGYGRAFGSLLAAGISAKYVRESIDEVHANGGAVDAGLRLDVPGGLRIGLAVQNIGPSVQFQSRHEELPLIGRGGAAFSFLAWAQRATVAFDVNKTRGEDVVLRGGLELILGGLLAIRGGYAGSNDAGMGLTAGAGLVTTFFSLDYAFVPFGDLGQAHRLSASLRWGKQPSSSKPAASRISPSGAPTEWFLTPVSN